MAYTPRVFVKWKYTSDRGKEYVYKVLESITSQKTAANEVKVGGEESDGTEDRPADSFRPRVVLLYNAANKLSRRVVAFTFGSPLYCGLSNGAPIAGADNTLTLNAGDPAVPLTYTCYGYEGEKVRRERV